MPENDQEPEDMAKVEAERDALAHRVEVLEDRPGKRRRARRIVATVLVILTIVVFTVAVPGTWARRTLLNTDRYVATVAPLAKDPAIQEYLARTVTAEVFSALDVQDRLSSVLTQQTPRLAFLAGPIANGVEGFVRDQVQKIFASDAFATFWEEANRYVHAQLIAALNGGNQTVQVVNGKVVLNLLPLVNQGLQAVSSVVSNLIGRPITLPTITATTVPSEAISKLESTLGVTLPSDFGTIVVYDSKDLEAIQKSVNIASKTIILLVVLFIVLFALAMWVSPRRRRTLIQLTAAFGVILVVERRLAIAGGNDLVNHAKPENQAAARALVDQVQSSLLRYTGWLLALSLIVLVVALVSGPYPWAVKLRGWVRDLARAATGAARGVDRTRVATWVGAHRDALMLVGGGLAVLVFLFADLSVGWLLVLLILLLAYEVIVFRVAAATRQPSPDTAEAP
jgi:hypothetical protein